LIFITNLNFDIYHQFQSLAGKSKVEKFLVDSCDCVQKIQNYYFKQVNNKNGLAMATCADEESLHLSYIGSRFPYNPESTIFL